jgi:hypothetical protein
MNGTYQEPDPTKHTPIRSPPRRQHAPNYAEALKSSHDIWTTGAISLPYATGPETLTSDWPPCALRVSHHVQGPGKDGDM